MATAIRVQGLSKQYKLGSTGARYDTVRDAIARALTRTGGGAAERETFWALREVGFEVAEGEVVGIIGRNGAGKTTLLRILSRITRPTSGRAEIFGRVGSLLEVGTGFHPELTGRENVFLNGAILGMRRAEVARKLDDIIEFAGVQQFVDTPVKRYSSGMHVRLAFAVAAHLEPEILLVDEVLAVGDVEFQRRSLGKMEEIGKSGRTVFLVSHSMPAITRICNRALQLERGRVVGDGPASDVVARYLTSEHGTSSDRLWSADEAPGDEHVRLRRLRVVDTALEAMVAADVRQPVGIEVIFEAFGTSVPVVPWLILRDERGGHVFSAVDTDPRWRTPPARGRHVARAWIPPNLLNEGLVTAEVELLTFAAGARAERHAYSGESAVAFQVVDPGEGGTARGDFVGAWVAPVRPLLEWTVEQEATP